MPEPISSSNASLANASYDPTLDDAGQVCRNDVASSQQSPVSSSSSSEPAVAQLVSSLTKPPALPAAAKSTAAAPPAASTANNNAQRTSERSGIAPYADAAKTGAGDAAFAGVALLKGRDPKSGHEAEVLSASAQVGLQTELQAGIVRAGASGHAGAISVEAFTVRAHVGIHNDDGSTGFNLGFVATEAGAEATAGTVNSATAGIAEGGGMAGSVGLRDLDHDGKHEVCARVVAGPGTLGGCVEMPF